MFLVLADTHFSSKPRDEYRFGLFNWLLEQQRKYVTSAIIILGDLTNDKDRHSSSLVNRVVDGLCMLKAPAYILCGNHDYIGFPFFSFISNIPGLMFVSETTVIDPYPITLIPHQKDQASFDKECSKVKTPIAGAHQTFDGAIAETGTRMAGLRWPLRGVMGIAGDIHRPQQCGPVTYCGSPFQVRFGDDYTPRVLLLGEDGGMQNLYFPAPKKWSLKITDPVDILNHKKLKPNDQVKITIELTRDEVVDWVKIKETTLSMCKERQVDVYGVELKVLKGSQQRIKMESKRKTNQEYFHTYCVNEQVPSQMVKTGKQILGG